MSQSPVELDKHQRIALLYVDNPPVNALSHPVRAGLVKKLEEALADADVDAIVLLCRGRTFIAGADIREFGRPIEEPHANVVRQLFESSSKPLVAAIHGTALGGGLEMALACHFRIALQSAKLGLPEVKLGLLPGGGGTQRLPRVVGVEKALEMITSGEPIGAAEALACGLIDELATGELRESAIAFAERVVAEKRPLRRIRDEDDKVAAVRGKPELFAGFRRKIARKTRHFEAPEACIQCIEAAVELPFEDGLERERELFEKLRQGEQSEAQRYYFFAERQANKITDLAADTPKRPIERVGILGAGTMGGGIAMNFANQGMPVRIVEVKPEALERGLGVVRRNYERSVKSGRLTMDDVDERMACLEGGLDFDVLGDCDLVIEAVFENMEIKKDVFGRLDKIAKSGAILASNTSYLDVNEIAAVTGRPEDVLGMHFFSPANVMKLLEVVRGAKTAPDVLATVMATAKKIGKVAVPVGVCHGFVGNRMLAKRRAQAEALVLEGALPWQVDEVLYDFGFPMGPFRMGDLAGLDIGWQKEKSTSSTLRELLCERGRLGQKSGAGYYVYDPETRAAAPNPEVEELVLELSKKKGFERREISNQEILERCLYPMVNEGALILEEKIAQRPGDIDVIWVNGYGWPVYRGGPMFWADHVGLDKIVDGYERFRSEAGADSESWQTAPLLDQLAREGRRFGDLA